MEVGQHLLEQSHWSVAAFCCDTFPEVDQVIASHSLQQKFQVVVAILAAKTSLVCFLHIQARVYHFQCSLIEDPLALLVKMAH